MTLAELARATGVPAHTIRHYIRQNLLDPPRTTATEREHFEDHHVERTRLITALTEYGRMPARDVRRVVLALDAPPANPRDVLRVAHRALPTPHAEHPVSGEVRVLVRDLGWRVPLDSPLLSTLTGAIEAVRAAGVPLDREHLEGYARAALEIGRVDVDQTDATTTPNEALILVTLGTVMIDPVLQVLRRIAQTAVGAERDGARPEVTPDRG